ncbi:MAG: hypothetical protein GY903_29120 [Fuerstiella sp.]|nr:hypothetical protein [Fuerstiella sp.]MCP4858558.1 hypothetical protein [Fuerstiella sp.]
MQQLSSSVEGTIRLEARKDHLGVLSADGSWRPKQVESVLTLGSGRAARAVLVKATDSGGDQHLCVEKIFRPGLLTRFIYRCAFQAPFGYQVSADAILACFYRRRVADALIQVFVPETRVARPLYARWDADSSAYALGSELIQGRGIRPASANFRMLRKLLPWSSPSDNECSSEEIDELVDLMSRLESLLRESGLVGSGWQVSKSAVVSTANLLRTDKGYVIVDLESGIPAMLVSHYVAAGLRLRSLPLFDDVDPKTLHTYLQTHRSQIQATLGDNGLRQLEADVERLVQHSASWKQAEIAVTRQGLPFVGLRFQTIYRKRCLDIWHRNEITDDETNRRFRNSSRLFTRLTYWCGCIPGPLGRFTQRYSGNGTYRRRVHKLITSSRIRRTAVADFCKRKTKEFSAEGRIADGRLFTGPGPRFQTNWLMSKVLPAAAQRWFSDAAHRQHQMVRLFLLIVSSRFQREFGQLQIRSAIREWEQSGRLYPGEHAALLQSCESQELAEYARCFGMHLSIKLAAPVLMPLKVGGFAAFAATGNFLYLLPIVVSPILRTVITLIRMISNARKGTAYGEALLIGTLPVIGNLAFPIQMYSSHPRLSTFLIRDAAARLSRLFPIYGGRDSRLEIAAIKLANIPLELLDFGIAATRRIRSWFRKNHDTGARTGLQLPSVSRWDRMADEQLELMKTAETQKRSIAESIEDAKPPRLARRAA